MVSFPTHLPAALSPVVNPNVSPPRCNPAQVEARAELLPVLRSSRDVLYLDLALEGGSLHFRCCFVCCCKAVGQRVYYCTWSWREGGCHCMLFSLALRTKHCSCKQVSAHFRHGASLPWQQSMGVAQPHASFHSPFTTSLHFTTSLTPPHPTLPCLQPWCVRLQSAAQATPAWAPLPLWRRCCSTLR